MPRSRRCLLFVPGNSLPKLSKAAQIAVDSIILDLEDGVGLTHKDETRQTISEALHPLDFNRTERLIRLNSVKTELLEDDLRMTVKAQPDGYVIPKVESPQRANRPE